ncbi:MAG: hypothetical protein R3D58_13025 [Saprospiraceae bacterium]
MEKTRNQYLVKWWIWNGSTFELHEIKVESVLISKCEKYRFFAAKNPVNPGLLIPGREWIVAEGGTGYVLAYGPTNADAIKMAKNRFRYENGKILPSDVTQYIQGHLAMLKQYVGKTMGYISPVPGMGIMPLSKPDATKDLLVYQMMV